MTPEERLRQVEILLGTAARRINENSEAIQQVNDGMNRLISAVSELTVITRQNQEEILRIWQYLEQQSDNGRA